MKFAPRCLGVSTADDFWERKVTPPFLVLVALLVALSGWIWWHERVSAGGGNSRGPGHFDVAELDSAPGPLWKIRGRARLESQGRTSMTVLSRAFHAPATQGADDDFDECGSISRAWLGRQSARWPEESRCFDPVLS